MDRQNKLLLGYNVNRNCSRVALCFMLPGTVPVHCVSFPYPPQPIHCHLFANSPHCRFFFFSRFKVTILPMCSYTLADTQANIAASAMFNRYGLFASTHSHHKNSHRKSLSKTYNGHKHYNSNSAPYYQSTLLSKCPQKSTMEWKLIYTYDQVHT